MSLASTINKNFYLGNGTSNSYNYTFKIFKDTDLKVIVQEIATGIETVLNPVDYVVNDAGDVNGGTIDLVGPRVYLDSITNNLLSTYKILLKRELDLVQETDIRNQGDFFPEVHEDQFDRGIMIDQQLKEQADRSLRLAETTEDFDPTVPASLENNPGASFIVNPTGDGFEAGPTADQIAAAQAEAIAAAASAAAALVSENLAQDWAIKTDAPVNPPGDEYSSKEYAVGVQRRGLVDGGSSKDWANYTGGTVDNAEFSSKKYAIDSQDAAQTAVNAVADIQDLIDALELLIDAQIELTYQDDLGYGDGIKTTFPLIRSFNGNAIIPMVNGLILKPSEYIINGGVDLELSFAPDITQKVEVAYLKSAQNDLFQVELLSGTVNGVNTTFTYTGDPKSIDGFLTYVSGKFVHKFEYTNNLTTKTIVLNTAPNFGQYVLAVYYTGSTVSDVKQDDLGFGDGSKTLFSGLSLKPFNKDGAWVYVNGVKLEQSQFEIINDLDIQLNFAPDVTQKVDVVSAYVDKSFYANTEYRALTAAENSSRELRLKTSPMFPGMVDVDHQDASFLIYEVDFNIVNDKLLLLSTTRANAISTGEFLRIRYKV
jgi:hypothetical protein